MLHKPYLDDVEDAKRRRVYAEIQTDLEGAVLLGIHETSFRNWRRRRGLPAKSKVVVTETENDRRLAAWSATQNVHEAARLLGMDHKAYDAWMRTAGLRSRNTLLPRDPMDHRSKHNRYLRAYHQARSDAEAARLLGTTESAFSRWRRRHKLEQPRKASQQRAMQRKQVRRIEASASN